MKKYTFRPYPAEYSALNVLGYNPVDHRIINEELEKFQIEYIADDLPVALAKAKEDFLKLVAVNFSRFKRIEFYEFKLQLVKIEELV